MKYTLDRPMILYHAISSYQLLEVMLHRMTVHPEEKAVLLLPDFIVEKYPQYRKLAGNKFFDEVYRFPYLHIPHREEELVADDVQHPLIFLGVWIGITIQQLRGDLVFQLHHHAAGDQIHVRARTGEV